MRKSSGFDPWKEHSTSWGHIRILNYYPQHSTQLQSCFGVVGETLILREDYDFLGETLVFWCLSMHQFSDRFSKGTNLINLFAPHFKMYLDFGSNLASFFTWFISSHTPHESSCTLSMSNMYLTYIWCPIMCLRGRDEISTRWCWESPWSWASI